MQESELDRSCVAQARSTMFSPNDLMPMLGSPQARSKIRVLLNTIGFDTTDWVRVVMYRRCFEFIRTLQPESLDVLEIGAGPQWRRRFQFNSYTEANYPKFDICERTLGSAKFDLIIADQVFEHLKWPYRAGKNVHAMLRPGGHAIITVPFLLKVHKSPIDCSRWTEQGMSYLLQECGFAENEIKTESWGNRACVKANFSGWRKFGWYRSLTNEPEFPVMVWAYARRAGPLHEMLHAEN
jgi:SAM-dependent methyltransferase